jgi:two-component system, NtrC family, response regulator AlgB
MAVRVLIADDEPNIRTALRLCFGADDLITEAATLADAQAQVQQVDFDVAFVDLRLGEGDGLDVLRTAPRTTAVIIMTAFGTVETAVHAMRFGAVDYLQKPFDTTQVRQVVERAMRDRVLRGELKVLRAAAASQQRFEPSVSSAMRRVLQIADKAAASDATVLLRGESGTGKGVLARYLHERSARADRPFLTVDLSSIASTLLESELFGHTRGAFTGAAAAQAGRVETAAGGTLFLDEIGELPLALQPKLLRFVQEQEFERVGDNVTRRADVRIIAATNRDLRRMTEAGTFREDLYYRLKVIELEIPPLRERAEDVLPLAEAFLVKSAHKMRRPVRGFSPDATRVLTHYPWPGNVRELRNSIERAVILSDGPIADADLFSAEAEASELPAAAPDPEGDTLIAAERRHIVSVLAKCSTIEEAARVLGVDTVTLWRRRKKHGLG